MMPTTTAPDVERTTSPSAVVCSRQEILMSLRKTISLLMNHLALSGCHFVPRHIVGDFESFRHLRRDQLEFSTLNRASTLGVDAALKDVKLSPDVSIYCEEGAVKNDQM